MFKEVRTALARTCSEMRDKRDSTGNRTRKKKVPKHGGRAVFINVKASHFAPAEASVGGKAKPMDLKARV